jgi:hypothetical protein
MIERLKRVLTWRMVLALVFLAIATPLVAQVASPPPAEVPPAPMEIGSKIILAVGAALTSVLTWAVRAYVLKRIPRILIPTVLVPLLGSAITYVQGQIEGGGFNILVLALLTTGAVWLHEIKTTAEEHGAGS